MSCSSKKSLNEIFYMTSILTCMVVLIHTGVEPSGYYDMGSLFNILVFSGQKLMSFAVPGFIFLSAFKLFYSKSFSFSLKSYGDFMYKRITKIFIPYSVFALVYYMYFVSNKYSSFDLKELLLGIFLRGDISAPFYFVIVIFQFYMLTPVFSAVFQRVSFKVAVPIAIAVNMLIKEFIVGSQVYFDLSVVDFYVRYNDRIFISYISYWVIGGYAGLLYQDFKATILKHRSKLGFACILIVLAHTALSYFKYTGLLEYKYAEAGHVVFCIASILFTYNNSLALEFLDIKLLRSLASGYSKISYYVYLSHVLFIYMVDNAMNDALVEKIYVRWAIRTAVAFAASGALALILGFPKWNIIARIRKRVQVQTKLEN